VPEISHQPDERLELYALGRLPEPEVAVVEEHLLVCVSCQKKLDEVELFAVAMRQAITLEPAAQSRAGWLDWLRSSWVTPWSFVGASAVFAAIMLATIVYLHPGRNVPPLTSLNLAAMRGDVQQVGPAQETDITLTDAPTQENIRVEVVDSTGGTVWSGQPGSDGEEVKKIKIARQLAPGSYFVRLFDQSEKLLHEYGFNVRPTRL
jgi:Putative zinc-finger